jgi:hypothetical protein
VLVCVVDDVLLYCNERETPGTIFGGGSKKRGVKRLAKNRRRVAIRPVVVGEMCMGEIFLLSHVDGGAAHDGGEAEELAPA